MIIEYATEHHLENLIAIDNTASSTFVENYIPLESSFDLISSNKVPYLELWFLREKYWLTIKRIICMKLTLEGITVD
jgi:hypothetical protein